MMDVKVLRMAVLIAVMVIAQASVCVVADTPPVKLSVATVTVPVTSINKDAHTLFLADYDNVCYEAVYAAGEVSPKVHGHPQFKQGKRGSAILLTKDNYLEYPAKDNIHSDQGTLEFWYQAGHDYGGAAYRHMITVYNSEQERFYIRQMALGNIAMFFMNKKGTNASMAYDAPSNGWHHIAITWQKKGASTELSGYVDGHRKTSKHILNFPDFSEGRIIVGNYAGSKMPLNGMLDDVRISDHVRYTEELYPEFFFTPDITPLKKLFFRLQKSAAPITNDAVNVKKELLYDEISRNLTAYDVTNQGVKLEQYQIIKGLLSELEDNILPFVWWEDREHIPLAAMSQSCMKKINDRWSSMPASREHIALYAAGGEWQAFQIVLAPGLKDVSGITVKALSLQSGENQISEDNVHIFRVGTLIPENTGSKKVWADPIYPIDTPLAIPLNRIQPLWVSIKVPPETPKGQYEGAVVVEMDGAEIAVPYQMNVYGFTLPVRPRLKTCFGFAGTWMAKYYNLRSQKDIEKLLDSYLENMLAYKVSPKALWRRGYKWNDDDRYFLAPRIIRDRDGKWRMEFADYDKQLDKLIPLGLNSIMVGLRGWAGNARGCADPSDGVRKIPFFDENTGEETSLTVGVLSSEHETLSKWMIKEWYSHLKKRGLTNMAYTYVVDEPPPQLRPLINTFCGWIHDVAPELSNMITASSSENCPNVNIWCPLIPELSNKKFQTYINNNDKKVWTYVCCGPLNPNANFFTHQSALQNRLPFWIGYKFGTTGFLYYETGRSMYHNTRKFPGWPNAVGSEGDGFLVYPGKNGPINTIRFEYVRMGIQDVEYFFMLRDLVKELADEDKLRKQAEQLLVVNDNLIKNSSSYSKKWINFEKKKQAVAEMIDTVRVALNEKERALKYDDAVNH